MQQDTSDSRAIAGKINVAELMICFEALNYNGNKRGRQEASSQRIARRDGIGRREPNIKSFCPTKTSPKLVGVSLLLS